MCVSLQTATSPCTLILLGLPTCGIKGRRVWEIWQSRLVAEDNDTMKTAVLGTCTMHVLLLAAVVAGKEFKGIRFRCICYCKVLFAGERYVSSCEPNLLPGNRGTLEYPSPESRLSRYGANVDCTWKFQPVMPLFGHTNKCDRMVATVEFLDTEKDGDILEIVDSSTNRVLARLSGNSLDYPKQYVACSSELTIRFKSNSNWERGEGFKISYTTDSTFRMVLLYR